MCYVELKVGTRIKRSALKEVYSVLLAGKLFSSQRLLDARLTKGSLKNMHRYHRTYLSKEVGQGIFTHKFSIVNRFVSCGLKEKEELAVPKRHCRIIRARHVMGYVLFRHIIFV